MELRGVGNKENFEGERVVREEVYIGMYVESVDATIQSFILNYVH